MAKKKAGHKAAEKKIRGTPPRTILVRVERKKKPPTTKDVELAIKKALDTQPTDFFKKTDVVIILSVEEGGRQPR
jgi:hypothetical protein